ncbi:MAG: DUF4347 domain-containing protein [Chitinophagales bacterium]
MLSIFFKIKLSAIYTLLRRGDRLPSVTAVQLMLNNIARNEIASNPNSIVELIAVDGIFGSQTERRVKHYQSRLGYAQTGVLEPEQWRILLSTHHLNVKDYADTSDIEVQRVVNELNEYGGETVTINQSIQREEVFRRIISGTASNSIVLLRIFSHGGPGYIRLTSGITTHETSIHLRSREQELDQLFRSIKHIMVPYGSMELHGCRVGQGAVGARLLSRIANVLGVPVSAGRTYQYMANRATNNTFRFEGRTHTKCPNGMSLRDWSESLL